jgi:DNA-binding transcriptional regulator YdaS (Cro superfamily)
MGRSAAAQRLGVPVAILEDWLAGRTDIPDHKISTLLDLLDDLLDEAGEQ